MKDESRATVCTTDKAQCCGCRTCEHVCPVHAIRMEEDACGFLYPKIDEGLCIRCGRCLKTCAFQSGYLSRKEFDPYYGYGIRHKDEKALMHSRSGAAFVALTDVILGQGGLVFGAGYDNEPSPFTVVHKSADDKTGRDEFCGSKYVQSDLRSTFPEVREALEAGRKVLFSGTGCQVGALHKYLGKEYDNLVTVDIICHGVPSPKLWRDYVAYCESEFGAPLESVDFREKQRFGWSRLHVERLKASGEDHYSVRYSRMYYLEVSRPSCFSCPYANQNRPGDITLGDFWGHEKALYDLWDDDKGISLVLVNTQKGVNLLQEAKRDLEVVDCTGFPFQHMTLKGPVKKSERYEEFWDDYQNQGLAYCLDKYVPADACTNKVNTLLKKTEHFDAGLVVFAANNYGSCATNVALYYALKNLGLRPLVLDTLAVPDGVSRRYMRRYLNVSSAYTKRGDADWANQACDTFIIGSDQCWRFTFARFKESFEYFLLAFTSDDKRRISYASSFGVERYDLNKTLRTGFKNLLGRFHAVSVREDYAVNMCKRLFGVDAVQVADPVFLLRGEDYAKIAEDSKVDVGDGYMLAYILEPSSQKRDLLRALSDRLGLPLKIICDAKKYKKRSAVLGMSEVVPMPEFADWMSYFVHAKHVVTDSFHGTCFSLILGKDCTVVQARVTDRFESLAHVFDECEEAERPIFYKTIEDALEGVYSARAGSVAIADTLAAVRESSLAWLNSALGIETQTTGLDRRDVWLDYALLKKSGLAYKYHYEDSVRSAYERIAAKQQTHLGTLMELYKLPGREEKAFASKETAAEYFPVLHEAGLANYTLLLASRENCSTYWDDFVRLSGLPLSKRMKKDQSYYAIVHSGKLVKQETSSKPLDLRTILYAPSNAKAKKSLDLKPSFALLPDEGAKGPLARLFKRRTSAGTPLMVHIHSMHFDKTRSQNSTIEVNSVDYSLNMRGINVVVIENASGCVVDTFNIDLNGDAYLSIKRAYNRF